MQDEFSRLVEKWNAQRAQAVAHALLKVLYPLMEKEMRNKLLLEAKEHVLQVCTEERGRERERERDDHISCVCDEDKQCFDLPCCQCQ